MDELIKDLLANKYLITPPAYFVLSEHYKKEFTLTELIKFTKQKFNTFIIDDNVAKAFLEYKGLLSAGVERYVQTSAEAIGEELPEETGTTETYEKEPSFSAQTIEKQTLKEHSGELREDNGYTVEFGGESGVYTEEIETSISTGNTGILESLEGFDSELNGKYVGKIGGTSSVSTGTIEDEVEYNGEEAEVRRQVVEEYGALVPIEEEEIPEEIEEKKYSIYKDFKVTLKKGFEPIAKEIKPEFEIKFDVRKVKMRRPRAKNANGKEGEIIIRSYEKLFRSRLRKLRKILRENPEISGVVDIGKLGYINSDGEITIIGLINSKRETAKGFIFEVEDTTGITKVFIGRDSEDYKKAYNVLLDSVVAFKGYYSKKGILFANHLYLPDVPLYKREKPPLEEKVYAVLISDIHVGSTEFCEKAFMKFIEWLNGNVGSRGEEEIVSRIKYMIMAGDVVDGIGIYPGQYNELNIPDIFDQYEALANLLSNVPDHIQMFIGPGNHDAARTALPQPEFYKEYAKPLYDLKNAIIISNPALINLHGRDFLIVHGRGIEDVVGNVPGVTHHKPAMPMVELLKLRHLAPTFGEKVPIAPDPEDLLVIEEVPDLVQMGHVHVLDYQVYRGIFLINSATWQAQTEFQKMVNIVPTPARVPIMDIETARLKTIVDFTKWC